MLLASLYYLLAQDRQVVKLNSGQLALNICGPFTDIFRHSYTQSGTYCGCTFGLAQEETRIDTESYTMVVLIMAIS